MNKLNDVFIYAIINKKMYAYVKDGDEFMGILDVASNKSAWRGYEYHQSGNVVSIDRINDTTYSGTVKGSGEALYNVTIDTLHPRKSVCNCPFADGKQIVCKHKVALYFKAFPEEAEKYYNEVMEYEELDDEEWDDEEQDGIEDEELYQKVMEYIFKMKKSEAQQALYEILSDGPEWQFDRFVREHWIE